MPETLSRLRRSLRVARTGARIYVGYRRTRRRARRLPPPEAAAAWEARHEEFAELLYDTAAELRGLFIKTGQFAGTRSDIFPAPYIRWLSQLQDRLPPVPTAVIRGVIEHELRRPLSEIFAEFEDRPLASASLAQVHRAWLPDGLPVAVKVQYPGVGDLIRLDARNLRTLVRIAARLEPNFDLRSIVQEITSQVPLELDFVREAALTRRLGDEMANVHGVVVPPVIDHLVSPRVLVTGFLEGRRLFEHGATAEGPMDERERIARTLAGAYGHQILLTGVFQADPHPGNILLLPDGRLGLLDFGLTKELPDAVRLGFAQLVLAASDRNPAAISEAFRSLGLRARAESPEELLPLVQLFFDARPDGSSPTFRERRRETLRRTPIEAIPGDLVLLGRVVGLLRGVCTSMGVSLSPMQMLRPYAEVALAPDDGGAGRVGP